MRLLAAPRVAVLDPFGWREALFPWFKHPDLLFFARSSEACSFFVQVEATPLAQPSSGVFVWLVGADFLTVYASEPVS